MIKMRDKAQQYKKLYAQNNENNLNFLLMRNFIKYIAPSLLLIFMSCLALYPLSSLAEPQGFSKNELQRSAPQGFGIESTTPNTIQGVLNNGHDNDYVVLEGIFVSKDGQAFEKPMANEKVTYLFTDEHGDSIEVDITHSNNANAPIADRKYYIWGTVKHSLFNTSINVIEYTPII